MQEISNNPICATCGSMIEYDDKNIFSCKLCNVKFRMTYPVTSFCSICNYNKYFKINNKKNHNSATIFCSNYQCPSYQIAVARYPDFTLLYLLYSNHNLLTCKFSNDVEFIWNSGVVKTNRKEVKIIRKLFFKIFSYKGFKLYKEENIYKVQLPKDK